MKFYIDILNERFTEIHRRSWAIVEKIPAEKIYWQPREIKKDFPVNSCGEYILRSAGAVEQAFGGLTVKLWDDPFEWTLPEALSTNALILNYLSEVEETKNRGFALFQSDEDLKRQLPAPEKLKNIFTILIETIARAENLQGRASAIFKLFSDEKI